MLHANGHFLSAFLSSFLSRRPALRSYSFSRQYVNMAATPYVVEVSEGSSFQIYRDNIYPIIHSYSVFGDDIRQNWRVIGTAQ